jgi:hypothetical protein
MLVHTITVGFTITYHQAKEYGGVLIVPLHNSGSVRNRLLLGTFSTLLINELYCMLMMV